MQPYSARRIASVASLLLTLGLSGATLAQEGQSSMNHGAAKSGASQTNDVSLVDQFAELRAKVARLEAALEQDHQRSSTRSDPSPGKHGMAQGGGSDLKSGMGMMDRKSGKKMGMMKMGDKMGSRRMGGMSGGSGTMSGMGMGGMGMMKKDAMNKGMGVMGTMKGMGGSQKMAMQSALPGFPGASHLYHIGATGFFIDHSDHVQLTTDQQSKLNQIKEKASLEQATAERQIEEAEQQLWRATASDQPDTKAIEANIRKIEKLRGDQRLAFIRAVGEAAKALTHEQHRILTGVHPDFASSAKQTSHQP